MKGSGFWGSLDSADRTVGKFGIWECIISGMIFTLIGLFLFIWGIHESDMTFWIPGAILIGIGIIGGGFCYHFRKNKTFQRYEGAVTTANVARDIFSR